MNAIIEERYNYLCERFSELKGSSDNTQSVTNRLRAVAETVQFLDDFGETGSEKLGEQRISELVANEEKDAKCIIIPLEGFANSSKIAKSIRVTCCAARKEEIGGDSTTDGTGGKSNTCDRLNIPMESGKIGMAENYGSNNGLVATSRESNLKAMEKMTQSMKESMMRMNMRIKEDEKRLKGAQNAQIKNVDAVGGANKANERYLRSRTLSLLTVLKQGVIALVLLMVALYFL